MTSAAGEPLTRRERWLRDAPAPVGLDQRRERHVALTHQLGLGGRARRATTTSGRLADPVRADETPAGALSAQRAGEPIERSPASTATASRFSGGESGQPKRGS